MNCDFVKEKIYERVYSNTKALDNEVIRHIDDCPDCNDYYEECQSAKKFSALLNQRQPVLNDPQKLTDDILDAINELETEKKSESSTVFLTVKRLLAAASVCLMIVFGYEHYVVVEKLIKLEEQMSAAPGVGFNSLQDHNISYYYSIHKSGILQSGLIPETFTVQDKDLKSLFFMARLNKLSPDVISKRLQGQLSHYELSNTELNILNAIKIE